MPALAPGHHLYPVADGSWRHSSPDGRFVRITGDADVLTAFQRAVHGLAAPALDPEQQAALAALERMFAERDLLAPRAVTTPQRSAVVLVQGDNPIAAAVAALLDGHAQVNRDPVDEGTVRNADLLIDCAGWLPDSRWQRRDATGVSWHRVHVEGTVWYAGPLTVPGRTASFADLRGRRLAASGVPDELTHQWAYLDDAAAAPPVPWPDAAGCAVVAGLLVRDVLHLLATGVPALPNVEVGIDLAAGTLTHHPVLPLPVTARS